MLGVQVLELWLMKNVAQLGPILGVLATACDASATGKGSLESSQGEWGVESCEEGASSIRMGELEEVMQEAGVRGLGQEVGVQGPEAGGQGHEVEPHLVAAGPGRARGGDQATGDEGSTERGLEEEAPTEVQHWNYSPWLHKFSSSLHLQVAGAELQMLEQGLVGTRNCKEEDLLWEDVSNVVETRLANLEHRRILLAAGQTDDESMLSGPGMPGWRTSANMSQHQNDTIAFTCGHHFGRAHYLSYIVPAFKQRLEGLPVSHPVAFSALVEDAMNQTCMSACPPCVFMKLRTQQLAADWRIPAWVP